ncbi:MAG: hypothetical protein R2865_06460 [Deinococcales bacterium]
MKLRAVILNGSYNINFTMDLAIKDMLFDDLAQDLGVPLEISPPLFWIFLKMAEVVGG